MHTQRKRPLTEAEYMEIGKSGDTEKFLRYARAFLGRVPVVTDLVDSDGNVVGSTLTPAPAETAPDTGGMLPGNLTVRAIEKALKACRTMASKTSSLSDGHGLSIRFHKGNKRSPVWLFKYTPRGGKQQTLTLGSYPVVGLKWARRRAQDARDIIAAGGDPKAERDAAKAEAAKTVPTFAELAEAELKRIAGDFKGGLNSRHARNWKAQLENHVYPHLDGGARPCNRITLDDLVAALTPAFQTVPKTGRELRQRVRAIMEQAVPVHIPVNIADGRALDRKLPVVAKRLKNRQHRPSLPYAAMPEAVAMIEGADMPETYRLTILWIIATACRSANAREARYGQVRGSEWIIDGADTKAGRMHVVPITVMMADILTRAEALRKGGDLIFPSRRGGVTGPSKLSEAWRPIAGALPFDPLYNEPATLHGFRTTFRRFATAELRANEAAARMCLAHPPKDAVEGAYTEHGDPRYLIDQRRDYLEAWGRHCAGNSAEVVQLHVA